MSFFGRGGNAATDADEYEGRRTNKAPAFDSEDKYASSEDKYKSGKAAGYDVNSESFEGNNEESAYPRKTRTSDDDSEYTRKEDVYGSDYASKKATTDEYGTGFDSKLKADVDEYATGFDTKLKADDDTGSYEKKEDEYGSTGFDSSSYKKKNEKKDEYASTGFDSKYGKKEDEFASEDKNESGFGRKTDDYSTDGSGFDSTYNKKQGEYGSEDKNESGFGRKTDDYSTDGSGFDSTYNKKQDEFGSGFAKDGINESGYGRSTEDPLGKKSESSDYDYGTKSKKTSDDYSSGETLEKSKKTDTGDYEDYEQKDVDEEGTKKKKHWFS